MRILMIVMASFLTISIASGQQVADLLPDDNEIPGWVKNGPPQTAQTDEELFGLINGAAPVYLNNGFVECIFQDYLGTIDGQDVDLQARVFDQGTPENAEIVYDLVAGGLETDWDGAGSGARINYLLPFNFTLEFWRNRFYVYLVINREADSLQALQTIQSFAIIMDDVAVPVELIGFHAQRSEDAAYITWSTANEMDCFGFHILRSSTIDQSAARAVSNLIPGAGTTTQQQYYHWWDREIPAGDIFYWLEEIDTNGTDQIFGPIPLLAGENTQSWGATKATFSE